MSVTFDYNIDPIELSTLLAAGNTHLRLYYANGPDLAYAYASVEEALVAATYSYTFTYSGGNPAQYFKVVGWDGASITPLSQSSPFHGGGGTTLAELRRKFLLLTREGVKGTTTGTGSTTTFVCANQAVARHQNDHYNNWQFYNVTDGEWSVVSDWVQSTTTGTLAIAVATSLASGKDIELYRRFTPDEIRDALNWAIASSWPILARSIDFRGFLTANDIYTYQLPNDIKRVSSVEYESGLNSTSTVQATRGQPWRRIAYRTFGDGLDQYLEFKQEPWNFTEETARRLRIRGSGPLSQLNADTDYVEATEPQTSLLLYLAAHRLYTTMMADASKSDIDRYQNLASYYLNLYQSYKDMHENSAGPISIFTHDPLWNS